LKTMGFQIQSHNTQYKTDIVKVGWVVAVSIRHTYSFLPNHHHAHIITATEEVMMMMPTVSRRRKRRRRIRKGIYL